MKIRTLLLASAVPFAVTGPVTAAEIEAPGTIILAQNEPCAPDDAECLQRLLQEQQQQRSAEEQQPEQQAQPESAPEPTPDAQPQQQAAPEPAPEPEQQAQPEPAPQPETQQAEPAPEPAPETQQAAPEPAPQPEQQQAAPETTQDAAPEQQQGERRRRREERREQQAEPAPQPTQDQPVQQAEPAPQPAQEQPVQQQAQPAPTEPSGDNVVEQQLEAQGDTAEANKIRELRQKLQQAQDQLLLQSAPQEEQQRRAGDGDRRDRDSARRGDRDGRDRDFRRDRDRDREGEVVERRGDRLIIRLGDNLIIESGRDDNDRLLYGADDVEVVNLPGGRTQTTVYRDNGSQIITVRNRRGEIETRVRKTRRGREIVLIDNRYPDEPPPPVYFERELPPLVVDIPRDQYIVETRRANERQIIEAFSAPPVEEVERAYTLQEITRSERLRDKVRRIDLDTITFDFGSATIGRSQYDELARVGLALEDVIADSPDSVFLIEGHTDAVGSDYDNLILSDRRAEAVAVALSQNFDIPPENLVTEGYGEQYLKVNTQAAERENRRVTMRNITELMASN